MFTICVFVLSVQAAFAHVHFWDRMLNACRPVIIVPTAHAYVSQAQFPVQQYTTNKKMTMR